MPLNTLTPWHKASFDQFLSDTLPQLLAEHIPLGDYQVKGDSPTTVEIQIALNGGVQTTFTRLPLPDGDGLFHLKGEPYVVVPTASQEELDIAEIACAGEQLLDFIQGRLGQASNGITWSEDVLRAWLPLDRWFGEFFQSKAQRLDQTNWLSRHTHLRRILIPGRQKVIAPGQFGRVCPYETPESANMGKVFTVAVGAEIRNGKIIILNETPAASLGLSVSMLPFLEHNDPNRLLMAANMQRQVQPTTQPEPALVQTGMEPPDAPDFWCGHNFLTALMSLGEAAIEDGIVISESAAKRMRYSTPVEPGDKFCNRHGIKGVISQILPDECMPHLPDGTPIELVYSFSGIPVRMIYGLVLETAWGYVAHAEDQPVLAPPFAAPSADELHLRLVAAGLPEEGQVKLTLTSDAQTCELPSTVGWVYWSRAVQRAGDKISASTATDIGLAFGEMDFQALKTTGAVENIREAFSTRSIRNPEAASLADQLTKGPVKTALCPTPWYSELARRLQATGIRAELENGKLAFTFITSPGNTLKLAKPIPHPWLHEKTMDQVGIEPGEPYQTLVEANDRLAKLLASRAPSRLVQSAYNSLAEQVETYFNQLLPPELMSLGSPEFPPTQPGCGELQVFSGNAVASPGDNLRFDQVGLPEEIAWTLFTPVVKRLAKQKLGINTYTLERTPTNMQILDEVMATSWVIIQRSPVATSTGLLAYRPVRNPSADRVIRLHHLALGPLNADYDGDEVAVYLPVTAAAQQEAGEKLSLAAHLQRDPSLVKTMLYQADLLWGLAWHYQKPGGKLEIANLLSIDADSLPDLFTQDWLHSRLIEILQKEGVESMCGRLELLTNLGYQAARRSGASISPFFASHLQLPPMPESDAPGRWRPYIEEVAEAILAGTNFTDPTFGPQLLLAQTRERNRLRLPWFAGMRGLAVDAGDQLRVIRHTQIQGWTPEEAFACIAGARRGFAAILLKSEPIPAAVSGWNLLARARRAKYPGIVFARAAASGEIDPLEDLDSKLRVGKI